mmetsp:Transcript_12683/g.27420  ORF Transcript_12683/g.27420 Transcript_12683/m.27420 type:complete len:279 (+) Transcript_12683:972-1808(+)
MLFPTPVFDMPLLTTMVTGFSVSTTSTTTSSSRLWMRTILSFVTTFLVAVATNSLEHSTFLSARKLNFLLTSCLGRSILAHHFCQSLDYSDLVADFVQTMISSVQVIHYHVGIRGIGYLTRHQLYQLSFHLRNIVPRCYTHDIIVEVTRQLEPQIIQLIVHLDLSACIFGLVLLCCYLSEFPCHSVWLVRRFHYLHHVQSMITSLSKSNDRAHPLVGLEQCPFLLSRTRCLIQCHISSFRRTRSHRDFVHGISAIVVNHQCFDFIQVPSKSVLLSVPL